MFREYEIPFPEIKEILDLSVNEGTYKWVINCFMKHGVGARNWNQQHLRFPFSKFCTPSTEALVLLILENSYDRWVDKSLNPDKMRIEYVQAKYTNGGISQRGGLASSRKGGGWSTEGIHRFNELCTMVKSDRIGRGPLELRLLQQLRNENTVKSWMPGQKKKPIEEEEEVLAMHDFEDVEEEELVNNIHPPLEGQV